MGNQLVGIAPDQILPVEQYMSDAPDLIFEARYVHDYIDF